MTSFQTWQTNFQQQKLPDWEQLPDIDLYMDQVIGKLNQILTPILKTEITKTMINSYVKKELVSRPEKKRYTRTQLAELIIISFFKPVFSLEEINLILKKMTKNTSLRDAYNQTVEITNHSLKEINLPLEIPQDSQNLQATIQIAIHAVIDKLITQELIQE